jgi:cell division protein FtsB
MPRNTTSQEDRALAALDDVITLVDRLDQEVTDLQAALEQVRAENKELEAKIASLE